MFEKMKSTARSIREAGYAIAARQQAAVSAVARGEADISDVMAMVADGVDQAVEGTGLVEKGSSVKLKSQERLAEKRAQRANCASGGPAGEERPSHG